MRHMLLRVVCSNISCHWLASHKLSRGPLPVCGSLLDFAWCCCLPFVFTTKNKRKFSRGLWPVCVPLLDPARNVCLLVEWNAGKWLSMFRGVLFAWRGGVLAKFGVLAKKGSL